VLLSAGETVFQRRHEIEHLAVSLGRLRRDSLLTALFLLNEREDTLTIRIVIPAGVREVVWSLGRFQFLFFK
jgi:hypothetical protein